MSGETCSAGRSGATFWYTVVPHAPAVGWVSRPRDRCPAGDGCPAGDVCPAGGSAGISDGPERAQPRRLQRRNQALPGAWRAPGHVTPSHIYHRRPRYLASATYRPERRAARSSAWSRWITSRRSSRVRRGLRLTGAGREGHRRPGSTASRRELTACGFPLMGGLLLVGLVTADARFRAARYVAHVSHERRSSSCHSPVSPDREWAIKKATRWAALAIWVCMSRLV